MTYCLSFAQQLPSKFFIVLKFSMYVHALIPHQIECCHYICTLLCFLVSDVQRQAVFTGYCNICTACNMANLSLVVHDCTSVFGQDYIFSFVCTMTHELAGNISKNVATQKGCQMCNYSYKPVAVISS